MCSRPWENMEYLVDKDLVKLLVSGELRGAGLDVFQNEPDVPKELFELDNVFLSPHCAVVTPECFEALENLIFDKLEGLAFAVCDQPLNDFICVGILNPKILSVLRVATGQFVDGMGLVNWILKPTRIPLQDVNEKYEWQLFGAICCKYIWSERNSKVYGTGLMPMDLLLHKIHLECRELKSIMTTTEKTNIGYLDCGAINGLQETQSLRPHWSILKVDAAWKQWKGTASVMGRQVDHKRIVLYTDLFDASSSLEAEFKAILLAVSEARRAGLTSVHVQSDSQVAIEVTNHTKPCLQW